MLSPSRLLLRVTSSVCKRNSRQCVQNLALFNTTTDYHKNERREFREPSFRQVLDLSIAGQIQEQKFTIESWITDLSSKNADDVIEVSRFVICCDTIYVMVIINSISHTAYLSTPACCFYECAILRT